MPKEPKPITQAGDTEEDERTVSVHERLILQAESFAALHEKIAALEAENTLLKDENKQLKDENKESINITLKQENEALVLSEAELISENLRLKQIIEKRVRSIAFNSFLSFTRFCVQEVHLMQTSEKIISAVQHTSRDTAEKMGDDTNRLFSKTNDLCVSVDYCVQTTDQMKDAMQETMIPMCDVIRNATARAIRSEHTSHVVRGRLGAQERKRRREDLNQIARLRNEVADLKRQLQAKNAECVRKDEMIGDLADRVEEMLCLMEDMRAENKDMRAENKDTRAENKANQDMILSLLAARL